MAHCAIYPNEQAAYTWQPFGPGFEPKYEFKRLGLYSRGFPIIRISQAAKDAIQKNQPVTFQHQGCSFMWADNKIQATRLSAELTPAQFYSLYLLRVKGGYDDDSPVEEMGQLQILELVDSMWELTNAGDMLLTAAMIMPLVERIRLLSPDWWKRLAEIDYDKSKNGTMSDYDMLVDMGLAAYQYAPHTGVVRSEEGDAALKEHERPAAETRNAGNIVERVNQATEAILIAGSDFDAFDRRMITEITGLTDEEIDTLRDELKYHPDYH